VQLLFSQSTLNAAFALGEQIWVDAKLTTLKPVNLHAYDSVMLHNRIAYGLHFKVDASEPLKSSSVDSRTQSCVVKCISCMLVNLCCIEEEKVQRLRDCLTIGPIFIDFYQVPNRARIKWQHWLTDQTVTWMFMYAFHHSMFVKWCNKRSNFRARGVFANVGVFKPSLDRLFIDCV
jgi:hypothetical protein